MNPKTDPNFPYRQAIQALADGYGYVPIQLGTASSSGLPSAGDCFEGLPHLSSTLPEQSSSQSATVSDLRQAFRECGFEYQGRDTCSDRYVCERLNSLNSSADEFIHLIKILNDTNHPVLADLNADKNHKQALIKDLGGVIRTRGLGPATQAIIRNSNHDPRQVFINFLKSL